MVSSLAEILETRYLFGAGTLRLDELPIRIPDIQDRQVKFSAFPGQSRIWGDGVD